MKSKNVIGILIMMILCSCLAFAGNPYRVDENMEFGLNDIYNATNVNVTNLYQNGSKVLDIDDINGTTFNHSTYADYATSWDGATSQADLNVNSSSYWDGLDSPADINAGDITDDGTYILSSLESNLNVNSSNSTSFWVGVSSFISRWFYNSASIFSFNETLMNETIDFKVVASNDSMRGYVDDQDANYNSSTWSFIDTQDDSYNSSTWNYFTNEISIEQALRINNDSSYNASTWSWATSEFLNLEGNITTVQSQITKIKSEMWNLSENENPTGDITAEGEWIFNNAVYFRDNVTIVTPNSGIANETFELTDLVGNTKILLNASGVSQFDGGNIGFADDKGIQSLSGDETIIFDDNNNDILMTAQDIQLLGEVGIDVNPETDMQLGDGTSTKYIYFKTPNDNLNSSGFYFSDDPSNDFPGNGMYQLYDSKNNEMIWGDTRTNTTRMILERDGGLFNNGTLTLQSDGTNDLIDSGNSGFEVTKDGFVRIPRYLYHTDDSNTYTEFISDKFKVTAGGTENFVVTSSGVGVGTDDPNGFDVIGRVGIRNATTGYSQYRMESGISYGGIFGNYLLVTGEAAQNTYPFHIRISALNALTVENDTGNVGIGVINPSSDLDVSGQIQQSVFTAPGGDPMCWDGSGTSLIGDCSSLTEKKRNITNISMSVSLWNQYMQLQPVTYFWKDNTSEQTKQVGFLAEQVESINPILADYAETWNITYEDYVDNETNITLQREINRTKVTELRGINFDAITSANVLAIQSIKTELEMIKSSTCAKDDSWEWC